MLNLEGSYLDISMQVHGIGFAVLSKGTWGYLGISHGTSHSTELPVLCYVRSGQPVNCFIKWTSSGAIDQLFSTYLAPLVSQT